MSARRLAAPLVLAALGACDAQAPASYQGEPLATLHGQVASNGGLPPLQAALLWQRGDPPSTDDTELATSAPVDSGFPAGFTLHVYVPPPAAARRSLAPGEPVFARANAAAVPEGFVLAPVAGAGPGTSVPAVCPSCAYGIDATHWLIYLPADVPATSLTAWWLGGAQPAGFHLVRVAAVNPACIKAADLDACARDLVGRGVADDGTSTPGTARGFCTATYKISPAPEGEELLLELGTLGLGPAGNVCP